MTSVDWQGAPCTNEQDKELWFSEHLDEASEAARRCGTCPLKKECADRAELFMPTAGIWAGERWLSNYSREELDDRESARVTSIDVPPGRPVPTRRGSGLGQTGI